MHISELYERYLRFPTLSTDTRKIEKNSIFLALKGDNFDGNMFARKAIEAGAAYALIDNPTFQEDDRFILVDNVLTSLQELARYHRDQLKIPIIGITGTNGKTTTKELVHAVLSQKFKTFATLGNLNNHIGVPLSVLSIDSSKEIAVIEMGANHQKEIEFLCTISKPTHGLITNVGKAHLEGFGSFEGVKKAKSELYAWLAKNKGTLFIQRDNSELVSMAELFVYPEVVSYGFSEKNDIYGEITENNPQLSLHWNFNGEKAVVSTHVTGAYNAENILAAIAIGCSFGLSKAAINRGIENYKPTNNRSQLTETQSNTLICDYYNANASSMNAALLNLASIDTDLKKTVVLGDMFELGEDSASEHQKLMQHALSLPAADCIFIGKEFYKLKNEKARFYETTDDAVRDFLERPLKERFVLLKASRGMAFEKIAQVL